jgi:hypothetical protein
MGALAGEQADPAQYGIDTRKLVARGRRESNSTATATTAEVLRLDGVPLKAGRHYRVSTSVLLVTSTVLNDVITCRLTHTTDGTTAVAGSTQLAQMTADHNVSAGKGSPIITELNPASDQTLSLLLTVGRTAGTGNVSIEGNAIYPICVWVDDMGPDTGDIGIEL